MGLFNSKRYTEEKADIERRLKDQEDELTALRKERTKLTQEVEDLKLKKKIEDEDIRHMVKIKTESLELDFKKREVDLEAKKTAEIAKVKDEYRDKTERQLEKRGDELRGMYTEILARLPNVNVELGRGKR